MTCNSTKQIPITIVRHISVDPCLAQEILFLNDQGVRTIACCCGHGKSPPNIIICHMDEKKAVSMGYNSQSIETLGPKSWGCNWKHGSKVYYRVIKPKNSCGGTENAD